MSTEVDATNESCMEFAVRDARVTPARGQGAVFGASCLEGSNLFEDHATLGPEKGAGTNSQMARKGAAHYWFLPPFLSPSRDPSKRLN